MVLDLHTVGLMSVVLVLLLSGMLVLTHFNLPNTRGLGAWALGEFFFGIGMGSNSLSEFLPRWMSLFLGDSLVCLSMALLVVGVLIFKNEKINWAFLWGYVAIVVALCFWSGLLQQNQVLRTVVLSTLFALPGIYGAKLLLIRIEQPLRTPYWMTGGIFATLVLTMLIRMIMALTSGNPLDPYGAEINNPHVQLLLCIGFLIVAFGFMLSSYSFFLMIHYRMAMNLEKLASIDALTGALNRRSLGEHAEKLAKRRGQNVIGIIMLDIDFFKSINDRFGHQAGDKVLQHLSKTAQGVLRGIDYFARVGGEEFCALLTDSDEVMTAIVAERIRLACRQSQVTYRGQKIKYTSSAGVSAGDLSHTVFEKIVGEADQALYFAKNAGRDKVMRWTKVRDDMDTETLAKSQVPELHYSFTASNFRSPDDPEY